MIRLQWIRGGYRFVVCGCLAFKTYPLAARELKAVRASQKPETV